MKQWITLSALLTRLKELYNQFNEYNPFGEIGLISIAFYVLLYILYLINPFGTERTVNFYMDHSWVMLTVLIMVEILKTWDELSSKARQRERNKELLD
jgi:hypothetical protein